MPHLRLPAPWIAAALLCVLAILARQFLIQPPEIGHACDTGTLTLATTGPWWCSARAAIIMTYAWGGLSMAAFFLAAAALILRREVTGALALATGSIAIVWYSYEAGALAIVVGALVLARSQARRLARGD